MPPRHLRPLAIGIAIVVLLALASGIVMLRRRAPGVVRYSVTDRTTDSTPAEGTRPRVGSLPLADGMGPRVENNPAYGGNSSIGGQRGTGNDTVTSAGMLSESAAGTSGTLAMRGRDGRSGGPGAGARLGPDGRPLPGAAGANGPGTAGYDPTAGLAKAGPNPNGPGDYDNDPEPNESQALIGGHVVRGEEPVEGASISLAGNSITTIFRRTNANGYYQFPPLEAGDYTLYLLSPQTTNSRRRMTVQAGEHRLTEDFSVPPLAPLEGVVTALDTGVGIADVEVQVLSGASLMGSVYTDANGAFRLMALKQGDFIAKAIATGYLPESKSFHVGDGGDDYIRISMATSAQVKGFVRTAQGSPAGGAYVALFGNWAFDDPYSSIGTRVAASDGSFAFSLPATQASTSIRVGAYKAGNVSGYSAPIDTANPPKQDVIITLPAGGTITGRIVDSAQEVVEDAQISIKAGLPTTGGILQRFNVPMPSAVSDASGHFSLPAIEAGETTLSVAADGYVATDKVVTVTDGATVDAGDIVLEDEAGAKPGRIFGVIVDELGNPMVDHAVSIKRAGGGGQQFSARTDSRGGFKIDDIPDGNYAIYTNGSLLRGEHFIVVDQTYPFAKPGQDRIYLVYDLGQSVHLRVLDGRGSAITSFTVGVKVRYNGANGYGGVQETFGEGFERVVQTSTGEADIQELLAGAASLTINVKDTGTEQRSITIPVGGDVDLGDIVIASGGEITGRVLSPDSVSLTGVVVRAVAPSGAPVSHPLNVLPIETQTDAGGNFRLTAVPAGTADLTVSKAGWATQRVTNVSVEDKKATNVGVITMGPGATLSGQVTTEAGVGISDMLVNVQGQYVYTDREGRYYFDQLKPESSTVLASDRTGRYRDTSASVDLASQMESHLNLTMLPLQAN